MMLATQIELAWLAGFWDGEGSIGLSRKDGCMSLVAQLSHTEADTVRHVLYLIDGAGIRGRGYTYQERDPTKHRDAHYIRITGTANVLQFARLMLQYAVTKRRHWEIAIVWAERRIAVAGGVNDKGHLLRGGNYKDRLYSPEDESLAAEISRLNRRGPADRLDRKQERIAA
jgi:hypothetical protein